MENILDYPPGSTIIEQGEEGHGFYVLQSGTIEIYKDDVLLNVIMFPGTIFGEMGDILGKMRTCSVKAKNHCKIAHVSGDSLETLIQEHPDIAVKIIKTLASRLERTTQKLADRTKESSVWSTSGNGNGN